MKQKTLSPKQNEALKTIVKCLLKKNSEFYQELFGEDYDDYLIKFMIMVSYD